MELVRFGLVGCGRIGATQDEVVAGWPDASLWLPYSHASAVLATEGASLVAVCDAQIQAAQAAARRYHVAEYYDDYVRMLACESLDALCVATRTPGRCELLSQAVDAGVRAFYCEKPLSNTLEEADQVAEKLSDRPFIYGTKRRFMPAYRTLREWAKEGRIGRVTDILVGFGYGTLFWAHPHTVDMAMFLAGDEQVVEVRSCLEMGPERQVVEEDPFVRMLFLRFANGISAHIYPSNAYDVDVVGTEGTLSVRNDGACLLLRQPSGITGSRGLFEKELVLRPFGPTATLRSIQELTDSVRDYKLPDSYCIRLAVANQEVLFAAVESQWRSGGAVSLPLPRRGLRILGQTDGRFA